MLLDPMSFHNSGDGRHKGGEEDRPEDTPLRNARITTPNFGPVVAHGHVTRSAREVGTKPCGSRPADTEIRLQSLQLLVGVNCIECSRDVQRKENTLESGLHARVQIIDDSEQSSLGGVPLSVCRLK